MGFSADLDLKGAGSNLSVNGGKTNVNADSKIVNEQSGIFSNEADLTANGKGSFTGAVFTTLKEAQANGKSNIVFKQGISSQDIKNTTSYEGEALSIGLSIGNTTGKPQATMNGIGYGTDSDSSITRAGIMGVAAAPTLNDIQEKVAKVLIDKGMSEDVANQPTTIIGSEKIKNFLNGLNIPDNIS